MAGGHHCDVEHPTRPAHELADIFRVHGDAYRETHPTTLEQRVVMRDIEICRTSALGGHLDVCTNCGYEQPSYNSCLNRHCPKCQALAQARWLDKRRERILPTRYFHVVFTLPAELRPLAMKNRRLCFNILFSAASATLHALAKNPRWLGAQIGFTAVLHTWARDLRFHPHLHCIVTGGGLALDGQGWVDTGGKYLFPVKVLGRLFRGKVDAALAEAHSDGLLELPNDTTPEGFQRLRRQLFAKEWRVYAKRPFAGAEEVYAYLGRYTHRVAISNHRILSVTDDSVTIATRDGATATMTPFELIRRFLNHLLPRGFWKIRHYGLLASSNVKTKLEVARSLLGPAPSRPMAEATAPVDWQDLHKELTGVDLRICPVCKSGHLRRSRLDRISPEMLRSRAPP